MSPKLATHGEHDRSGDPAVVLPARSEEVIDVRTLPEWAVGALGAVPTEPGHCHICGMLPGVLHRNEATEDAMHHGARHPQTLAEVADEARRAVLTVLGIYRVPSAEWGPEVAVAVRRLARDLDTMAWCAENP